MLRERVCVKQEWETSLKTLLIAEKKQGMEMSLSGKKKYTAKLQNRICRGCFVSFSHVFLKFFVCIQLKFRMTKL